MSHASECVRYSHPCCAWSPHFAVSVTVAVAVAVTVAIAVDDHGWLQALFHSAWMWYWHFVPVNAPDWCGPGRCLQGPRGVDLGSVCGATGVDLGAVSREVANPP